MRKSASTMSAGSTKTMPCTRSYADDNRMRRPSLGGGGPTGVGSGCVLIRPRRNKSGGARRRAPPRNRVLELAFDLALEGGQDALDVARLLNHVLERKAPGVSERARKQIGPVEEERLRRSELFDLGLHERARVGARRHLLVG